MRRLAAPLLAASLLAASLLAAMLSACLSARPPAPPEVAPLAASADAEIERVARIERILARDLRAIERLRAELLAQPAARYAHPFPAATFRHAAMSCLQNGAPDQASDPDQARCRPATLPKLKREATKAQWRFASAQLERVDAIRRLSATLRRREQTLQELARALGAQNALRRAELVGLTTQTRAARAEHTDRSWAATSERLGALERSINALDAALNALTAGQPERSARLARAVDDLPYAIAWLGLDQTIGEGD